MREPLRLHVGCGMNRRDGWVNCDLHKTPATDTTFDVQERWPFEDNSVAQILATHMLEHLDDPMAFFREAWRVLRPTGQISLQLPYGASDNGVSDITHKRLWLPASFCALQPGYAAAIGNPQHDQWDAPFSVDWVARRIPRHLLWLVRWPWRRLGMPVLDCIWNGYVELFVQLTALKTPGQVAMFEEHGQANAVGVATVAWMHDWDPAYTGAAELKQFVSGRVEITAPARGVLTDA